MPHGHCYLWEPGVVWLHAVSDGLIAAAYLSIPITLFYIIRKRRDLPFDWMVLCFSTFIVACGMTHVMEVWTLWIPVYWLSGLIKAITAAVSVATAVLLVRVAPKILELPSPAELKVINTSLATEIAQRKEAESTTRRLNEELERRVGERTYEWQLAYSLLAAEIEQRNHAEQSLRQKEEYFRELADAMPQIVWTATAEGVVDYRNQRWASYTGLDKDVSHDLALDDAIHLDDFEKFVAVWWGALEKGEACTVECRLRRASDGRYRWHLARAVPAHDSAGAVKRWYGTFTDIDDQKGAQEHIRQLNEELEKRVGERTAQLEAANKELEAFAYSVSHDLRAPLRAMDGFSKAVLEDYGKLLDERGQHYLKRVREASQKMGRLIDDLLGLSRFTRNELRLEAVDVSAMAASVIAELRHIHPTRQVETTITPGLQARADANLTRIVLVNLLSNAWKFTERKTTAHIVVGGEVTPKGLACFVQDDGAGFDMAYADKLFGAFQRLHGNDEFEGTGVGLATVKRIIHRHGGRVWAEAEVSRGATFHFTVPS